MYGRDMKDRLLSALALSSLIAALAMLRAAPVWAGPVDDQYAVAAGHYAQQRYAAAIDDFRKIVRDNADHPLAANARFFLAESLLQSGNYQQAAEAFEQFVADEPQHRFAAQASFRIGETAYLRGDFATALPKLQAFVVAYGNHKLAEYAVPYLADCQLETGDVQAAAANYQSALKSYPAGALSGECRLGLARIAQQEGDLVEARRFYEFLAQRTDTAAAAEARLRLGQLLYHQRDLARAKGYLEPLAQQDTASTQRTPARYWLGFVLVEQQQAAAAQDLWRSAIDEDAQHPLSPLMALAMAESLARQGKTNEALTWCERIQTQWRSSEATDDALALEIQLLLQSGKHTEVVRSGEQFGSEHPKSPRSGDVQEMVARALIALGKFDEAIARLTSGDTKTPQATLTLAIAQLGAKRYDDVLATLKSIDQDQAEDDVRASALSLQASALVALARAKEAIAPLQEYLENYEDGSDIAKCRAQLCVAYVQTQQFDKADTALKLYREKHATDRALASTTLYLAEAAAEAKQLTVAKRWFDELNQEQTPLAIRERAVAGLAWLAQQEQSPTAANEQLGELLKTQPASAQAPAIALRRAQNFEASGEREQALAAYLAFIKDHPAATELPDALLAAARLHDDLAQDREALVVIERLLKEFPQYAHRDAALYQAAWILVDLDRRETAAKHFATLHDEFRQSQFWLDATYRLAEHQVRVKRYDEAKTTLTKLVDAAPGDELLCHALYLQGQAAAAEGKWSEVAAPLTRLTHDYPKHALCVLAEYWLAEAEYRSGKLDEAGLRFGALAIRIEGRNDNWVPMVPLRQAQVLAHQKRWQEAHDLAAGIAQKHPQFRQQYEVDYLLGRALGALAKFDDARSAYQRVVQSPVGGRTETAAMAQWMIGETYFQQERYDDAIAAYHRVERLFAFERWQAAALLQAGKCHEAQGEYAEAIGLYAQLLKDYSQTTFAQDASQRMRVAQQRATTKSVQR